MYSLRGLGAAGPPSSWTVDPASAAALVWDPSKGTFIQTQNFTSDHMPDLATIKAAQNSGIGVKITDSSGRSISVLPSDNFLDIARANNLPLNAADSGANYALASGLDTAYGANKSQGDAIAAARASMLAQGFTDAQVTAAIAGTLPAGTPLDSRGIADNLGVTYAPGSQPAYSAAAPASPVVGGNYQVATAQAQPSGASVAQPALYQAATGAANTAASSSTVIGGFDFSAIPMWAWAGAAAVALLAFGGGGRGR